MITFTKLSIHGFACISDFEINLNTNHTVLIQARNGSGKTTLFSALVWALYGKNLKGVSDVKTWLSYRNEGYDGVMVSIYFTKDGHFYRVVRCQDYKGLIEGSKGGNNLFFFIDGALSDTRGKVDIQHEIISTIGMSYNLFMNSVAFGQGMTRLIQSSDSDKKDLFEEILDVAFLSRAKEISRDEYNLVLSKYEKAKRDNDLILSKIEDKKAHIKDLEDKRDRFNVDLKSKLEKRADQKAKIKEDLEKALVAYDEKQLESTETELEAYKNKEKLLRIKLKEFKDTVNVPLNKFVDQMIELVDNKDYKRLRSQLLLMKESYAGVESSQESLSKIQDSITSRVGIISDLKYRKVKVDNLKSSLRDINLAIKDLESSKPDFQSSINKLKDELNSLIDKSESLMVNDLTGLKHDLEILKWVNEVALGNKGIKAFLFQSSIGRINDSLASYSKAVAFNVKLDIDLNSTKKSFGVIINMDGMEVAYDELSGGQKQLVNLMIAFAMNSAVASPMGVNIAFLDEVFESLSADNIDIVTNLIKKIYKDKSLFLITHQGTLPIANAQVLRVEKKNGLATYHFD